MVDHLQLNGGGVGVVFGCETRETGEIFNQEADGILGLGNSEISVINQASAALPGLAGAVCGGSRPLWGSQASSRLHLLPLFAEMGQWRAPTSGHQQETISFMCSTRRHDPACNGLCLVPLLGPVGYGFPSWNIEFANICSLCCGSPLATA